MISKDFVLDENNNLIIEKGDLVIAQSDDQNIEAIMLAEKGQFYQHPLLGYGVTKRLYGPFNPQQEKRDIREELRKDDYNVTDLRIVNNEIFVDAVKEK